MDDTDGRQPRSGTDGATLALAGLLLLATIAFEVVRLRRGDFEWTQWTDRDLVRSAGPMGTLPTSGAELSWGGGARIPGGAQYIVEGVLLRLGAGPVGVWRAQIATEIAGVLVLGVTIRRWLGVLPAAVATAFVLASPTLVADGERAWNPGWAHGFESVAVAAWLLALVTRDAQWVAAWAFATALGAQMHLSAALLGLACGAVLLAARLRWTWSSVVSAMTAIVIPYVPFLVDEARRGWPDVRLLVESRQIAAVVPVSTSTASATREAAWTLAVLAGLGDLRPELAGAALHPVTLGASALASLVAVRGVARGLRRPGDARTVTAGAMVVLATMLCVYVASVNIDLSTTQADRHVVAFVPVLALLVALGVAERGDASSSRGDRLVCRLGSVIVLLGVVRAAPSAIPDAPRAWHHVEAITRAISAEARGGMDDALARTIVSTVGPGAETSEVDDLVQLAWFGSHAPRPPHLVSSAEPCLAVIAHGTGDERTASALAQIEVRALGEVSEDVTILGTFAVDETWTGLRYTTRSGCPSTVDDRYVVSEDEARARIALDWRAGTARRVDDGADGVTWIAALRTGEIVDATSVTALIRVVRHGDGTATASFAANQLRGMAWNGGFFSNERLSRPRLVVRDAAQRVVGALVLSPGLVGARAVASPWRADGVLPDGALSLDYDLVTPVDRPTFPSVGTTVSVPLDPSAR